MDKKKLTNEQILEALEKSERWGTNYQPDLEDIFTFLKEVNEKCGLINVEAVDDTLDFTTFKPLTPSLAFKMAWLLSCDGAPEEIEDDQTHFTLWWD